MMKTGVFLSGQLFLFGAAERRLDATNALTFFRPGFGHLEAEGAGLAVHHHDAGADLVDQCDIGGDDRLSVVTSAARPAS
jgi:hypothetical protein